MATFLTISESARKLRLHPQTLRNWIKQGIIKAYRPNPRGKIYIRQKDIDNMRKNPVPNEES